MLPNPATSLPHGPGFRFVTRMERMEAGVSGAGVWELSGSEPFFADHFPGRPIVPGVLLGEALAQLSGIVAFAGGRAAGPPQGNEGTDRAHAPEQGGPAARPPVQAGIGALDLRFVRSVVPPAQVMLETTVINRVGPLTQFAVRAQVDGKTVVKGELSLVEAV